MYSAVNSVVATMRLTAPVTTNVAQAILSGSFGIFLTNEKQRIRQPGLKECRYIPGYHQKLI